MGVVILKYRGGLLRRGLVLGLLLSELLVFFFLLSLLLLLLLQGLFSLLALLEDINE